MLDGLLSRCASAASQDGNRRPSSPEDKLSQMLSDATGNQKGGKM